MATIECIDLVKVYISGAIRVTALRGLNLKVAPGEFRVIVGPSGSGKTTLLNLIGGIDRPTSGRIVVDGEIITEYDDKKLEEYRRKKVGFVFQFFNLIPTLTALENVELPMILVGVPREIRRKRAMELLSRVGLADRAHHYPHQLSGGEQQRVAIAAALANDPPLILADEPTGELDTVTGQKIIELFKELNKELNKTLIIVTHDINIAMYADRISRIEDGRIVETFTPAELKTHLAVVSREERIRELRKRKSKLEEELKRLEDEFKKGHITADEFVNRYMTVKEKLKEVEEELKALTI